MKTIDDVFKMIDKLDGELAVKLGKLLFDWSSKIDRYQKSSKIMRKLFVWLANAMLHEVVKILKDENMDSNDYRLVACKWVGAIFGKPEDWRPDWLLIIEPTPTAKKAKTIGKKPKK